MKALRPKEREAEMKIRSSVMTGRWYAFKSYRQEGNAIIVTGKKYDVTDEVNAILAAHEYNLGKRAGELPGGLTYLKVKE